ncbi:MAG: hypothetical protein JJU27_05740, partial [Gammaproteobacteria bacterium]|nr:hypothetical protein [Gammaproteobacteria bacterium]
RKIGCTLVDGLDIGKCCVFEPDAHAITSSQIKHGDYTTGARPPAHNWKLSGKAKMAFPPCGLSVSRCMGDA